MNPKVNYALVGAFVIFFGSALIAWIFWLGVGTEKKAYETYIAYMYQSVSGLNTNAAVKYRGVEVGKVKTIALDLENPERVKLLLDIEQGTPIKEDSIAILSTQGLTGLGFIELSGGSKEAPILIAKGDQPYPEIITGPSLLVRMDTALTDMFVKFTVIAEEIGGVSRSVKALLSDTNQQSIQNSLSNIEQMTAQMKKHAQGLDTHLKLAETILNNTTEVSEDLPEVLKNLSLSLQGIQQIVTTVDKTTKTIDQAVLGTQQELSRSATDTFVQMSHLLEELQRSSQALNRLLLDFERNPNMFIFGRKSEKSGPGEQ